jgi:hypothetical protein
MQIILHACMSYFVLHHFLILAASMMFVLLRVMCFIFVHLYNTDQHPLMLMLKQWMVLNIQPTRKLPQNLVCFENESLYALMEAIQSLKTPS